MRGPVVLILGHMLTLVTCLKPCPPPPGTVQWDPNPGAVVYEVTWGYGLDLTCHTVEGCNLSHVDVADEIFTTDNETDVQLHPIQLQTGNVLRFVPLDIGTAFPFMPYNVDEIGFITCNTSRGVPLLDAPTNQSFDVPQNFLQDGPNYFIADSDLSPLVSCSFGLRINITVKSSSCHRTHGAMCSGWGVCVSFDDQPNFECHCCGNYRGDNCEIFDSCLSHPCRNGGICSHPSNDSHEYICTCPFGFSGTYCQNKILDLCDLVECNNNGTCTGNSTNFECDCPPGLTGTHCEVDINDCEPSPCVHGKCVDQRDGFKCLCHQGYQGDTCSERLKMCSLSPCKNGGFCHELATDPYEFTCKCKPGWAGTDCTEKIPPCIPNPCSQHGICGEDHDGGFSCMCSEGYTGTLCEININDCDPNPCKYGGHCRDGVHAHTCLCIHSHAGSNCQFTLDLFSPILEDVDASGGIMHNPEHTRNLYIVAGCLSAVILIIVTVLVVCYCRISQSHLACCGLARYFWYKRHRDNLTLSVDVTSASDCPLAVDAFWKPVDGESEGLRPSSSRLSFQNHTV